MVAFDCTYGRSISGIMKYYTGVGSRAISQELKARCMLKAAELDEKGYILRSGGAEGADTGFSLGAQRKEIYVPWMSFTENDKLDQIYPPVHLSPALWEEAIEILKQINLDKGHLYHILNKRSYTALHTRNVFQVLGADLESPSDFLWFCSPTDLLGAPIGGTKTAWLVAQHFEVPCYQIT